ncbi:MAG: NADH-quinone oxidoreductase subunit L [Armatimonadetes bacterium CG2_30_59_28]|nr:NADH-quinone oxidoreductase subunit L [Armatimonadota bacterium]OIO91637.1 MAG: NADH-quinone oxidoreductase subunit L [Armatimonadetes bacterium CG2_30_59_28]PIU61996.1 MAG: NADH-quinone oxidoreductase subunit L [Armatimonadetes bacterium CG07_land_8_20_14_0_80_59_28]PIY43037.1 MAG: NADH-quinone oxidoreductase subunit L [Armatimonadetes bacterium CG_4_10_14_3_um_filter_59_10]PJB75322.1 MAG: NADH-quinone oxidoreductase subunit L [Armatimonadetes bacterium CG_4_9_14_3_um_filter_58_7]
MIDYLFLTILLPLVGVLVNGFFGARLPKKLVAVIGCGTVGAAFLIGVSALIALARLPVAERSVELSLFEWMAAGDLRVHAALLFDPLSAVMLVVVSGIGLLIHVYSIGYMWKDSGFARYFTYLNLFIVSMLILILGNNFVVFYVGWELVGLCSYLLIGFWFHKPSAADAAKKAFIVNRVGDLGFALGIFAIFAVFGTVQFSEVFHAIREPVNGFVDGQNLLVLGAIAVLLFIGAMGKSAQIPLYVWLPDAMEGPTPVSALIHAATMVTAGVYMVARCHVLYELVPGVLAFVGVIGAVTAVLAASIALVQHDIKRVLAYSTISQLGYMFLGCGVGAYAAAIFHLMTHAFFKALLFLGSGSVIHSMEHAIRHAHGDADPQDMRNMGGLGRHMRITALTFVVGSAALAGVPFLSGFYSKEEILTSAWEGNRLLWGLGVAGAVMTAFYMTRQVLKTFFGKFRLGDDIEAGLHESAAVMTVPLLLLAVGAVGAGWIAKPLHVFLSPVFNSQEVIHGGVEAAAHGGGHGSLMVIAICAAFAGIAVGVALYAKASDRPTRLAAALEPVHRLLYNKYYVDEIYDRLMISQGHALSRFLANVFDAHFIDGVVNGVAKVVGGVGEVLKKCQTGYVRNYALTMAAGVVAILLYFLMR